MSGQGPVLAEVKAALAICLSEMMAEQVLRDKCEVVGVNADELQREHLPRVIPLVLGSVALFCGQNEAGKLRDRLLKIAEGGKNGKTVFEAGDGIKVDLRAVLKRTPKGEAALRGAGIPMLTRNILVGVDGKRDVLHLLTMYRGLAGIENALKTALTHGYITADDAAVGE